MFKRIADSFRFKKSKTPTETVILGITDLDTYIQNMNKTLDINTATYVRQQELINSIKQQTTKLITQKTNLVNQKKTLGTSLAHYKENNAKKLVDAISKEEYNKIVADYNERINQIVIEIQKIDAKLSLQQPSEITKGLSDLLILTNSGIDEPTTPRSNDPFSRLSNYNYNTTNDLNNNDLTRSNVLITVPDDNDNALQNSGILNEVPDDNDNALQNSGILNEVPDRTDTSNVSSGGYRYSMSSASRKNKYKKSSKKQSITRGGKRKHTRKHHKKGGNKRKHGRKSHKARK